MALLIPLNSNYGVSATYWRILRMADNFDTPETIVDVVGYASEAARLNGALPLVSVTLPLTVRTALVVDATRADAYAAIKLVESIPWSNLGPSPFANAEDV
jgi:hypothetical protein